jgi:hypothetical protein
VSACRLPCGSPPATPDYRCLGEIARLDPPSGRDKISLNLFVEDPIAQLPLPHASASACTLLGGCGNPSSTGADGTTTLTANHSVGGFGAYFDYLRIEGTDLKGELIPPSLFYELPPLMESGVPLVAYAFPQTEGDAFAGALGIQPDATKGNVIILPLACGLDFFASHLVLQSSLGGIPFYLEPGGREVKDLPQTPTIGGGFLNVPPGPDGGGDFSGVLPGTDGGNSLVFKVHVLVQPGTTTFIVTTPSPAGGW